MDRLKVLITGASGLLGKALIFENKNRYELCGTYFSNSLNLKDIALLQVDVSDSNSFLNTISMFIPDIIIHTAALTLVDLCEKEKELAYKINIIGTENVVEFARERQAKLVYISTDFVFDGKRGNYIENDTPNPINYYGFTKLKGEEASLSYGKSLVIRTSIFGLNPSGSKPGIEGIIKDAENGKKISAPFDIFYSPISANSLAKIIFQLVEEGASGIYHVGSKEKISRFDFFNLLFGALRLPHNNLLPIAFDEYSKGKNAPRPKDVSLRSLKVVKDFNIDLPDIESDIENILKIQRKYFSFFGG